MWLRRGTTANAPSEASAAGEVAAALLNRGRKANPPQDRPVERSHSLDERTLKSQQDKLNKRTNNGERAIFRVAGRLRGKKSGQRSFCMLLA